MITETSAPATWRQAKSIGDAGERQAVAALRQAGFRAFQTYPGLESRGDGLLAATIEFKRDGRAAETGHVAIEFESHGVPSGIVMTRSDFWGILADETLYLISTSVLRDLIAKPGIRRVTATPDKIPNRVALLPMRELQLHALAALPTEGV